MQVKLSFVPVKLDLNIANDCEAKKGNAEQ